MIQDEAATIPYEASELMMYLNSIIEESADLVRALDHLHSIQSVVLDRRGWNETKGNSVLTLARILLKLERWDESEKEYRALFDENPDSIEYLSGILAAKKYTFDSNLEEILCMLKEFQLKYPKSQVATHLALKYSTGAEFITFLDAYLLKCLRKGIPSLFNSVMALMQDTVKGDIISQKMLGYCEALKSDNRLSPDAGTHFLLIADIESETVLLWVYFFIARMYDRQKNHQKALEIINVAIEHSPGTVDLLIAKAKIYKHAGNPGLAMQTMNEARLLDLQDRFVNSKCTKYMIQNDQIKLAETTITLFTRSSESGPLNDLVDMQCLWYALAIGKSQHRQKQYGPALKTFQQIAKHFVDMFDDQFDFHAYSLRKLTLRMYVTMMRTKSATRPHYFHTKSMKAAIVTYLEIDGKSARDQLELQEMSESDRKKAIRKAKKAEEKALLLETAVVVSPPVKEGETARKIDDDPFGRKLLEGDMLEEAMKFMKQLQTHAPQDIETWLIGCKLYMRKQRLVLALKSVEQGLQVAPLNAKLHVLIGQLSVSVTLYQTQDNRNLDVEKVLVDGIARIFGPNSATLDEYNQTCRQRTDAASRIAVAEVAFIVDGCLNRDLCISELVSVANTDILSREVIINFNF